MLPIKAKKLLFATSRNRNFLHTESWHFCIPLLCADSIALGYKQAADSLFLIFFHTYLRIILNFASFVNLVWSENEWLNWVSNTPKCVVFTSSTWITLQALPLIFTSILTSRNTAAYDVVSVRIINCYLHQHHHHKLWQTDLSIISKIKLSRIK
jgi:hypothetical protein